MKARRFTKDSEVKAEEDHKKEKWLLKYLALQQQSQEERGILEESIRHLKKEIEKMKSQENVSTLLSSYRKDLKPLYKEVKMNSLL